MIEFELCRGYNVHVGDLKCLVTYSPLGGGGIVTPGAINNCSV